MSAVNSRMPLEIWMECWQYCRREELQRLCLVCKTFREICLPYLFYSAQEYWAPGAATETVARRNWRNLRDRVADGSSHFGNIRNRPRVALFRELFFDRHLGELLFHLRYSPDNAIRVLPHAYDRVPDINFGENVRKIHLGEIAIAKPMALTSFPQLENLELVAINFSEGPEILAWWAGSGETPDASQSSSNTTEFVSLNQIRSLIVDSYIHSIPLLTSLITHGPYINLLYLEVKLTNENVSFVWMFLHQCPKLVSIFFQNSDLVVPPADGNLLPWSAPLLHTYRGPPDLGMVLIPGRPVEDVTFEQQYWTEDLSSEDGYLQGKIALQQIVLSSAPLRRLCLPRVAYGSAILATIARLFPELRCLEIEIKNEIPLCEDEQDVYQDDYNPDSDTSIGIITRSFTDTSLQPERHHYRTLEHIAHDPSMADIPVDEEGLAIRSIKSFHGIMDRLTLGEISLPRNVEVLQITQQCFRSHTYFAISQHRRVLEDLPRLYPLLKRLVISERRYDWIKSFNGWNLCTDGTF